jgi:transcriptional regulator with XRE-family HTH domain
MSSSNFQDILQKKLNDQKMKMSELEKRASLSGGSVRRILYGKIPNPTLETMISISNVFGCSIDELIGRITINTANTKSLNIQEDVVLDNNLIVLILKETTNYIQKKDINTNLKTFMSFILETYKFFLLKKNGIFDQEFYDWYFQQTFGHTETENVTHLELMKKIS